ncbi:neuropeptide B isoform X2 [Peromyscus maniculatus bairdii]|uniref:neuropeptide B isoform X2 n=1 Tax=Peromyscus maniculatus bairdii TaxID=230844 RepID=UPI001C2E649B|nr:neuropeptide B isoform X2 [Peromyscus maniculatus bairdii]
MAQCGTLVAAALALPLLLLPPALAWYKPAAGPHHYSVGRAAGLLSSFHRFPSTRRSESSALPVGTGPLRLEMRPSLRSLSCQRQFNSPGTFQCKADVFLSLQEAECQRPAP